MAKTKIPPPAVSTGLTEQRGKLKVEDVGDEGERFSFNCAAPVFKKHYSENGIDKYEVEFMVPPFNEDFFKYELRGGGKEVAFWQATPEFFGEEKRMKGQMGKDEAGKLLYRKNDARVLGHNDTVQVIRKTNKAIDKKFWGKKPQVVKLPVKCEGPPNKTHYLLKTGVEVNGQIQYLMIVTLVYRVAKLGVKVGVAREKAAKIFVCDDLSEDSSGSDIDYDEDWPRRS